MSQKPALGKGLASLLPGAPSHTITSNPAQNTGGIPTRPPGLTGGQALQPGSSADAAHTSTATHTNATAANSSAAQTSPAPIAAGAALSGPTAPAGATAAGVPLTAGAHLSDGANRIPGISLAMVDEITPNPYQPRREFDQKALQELSDSIKINGVIQPLIVRRTPKGYELIAGERRLRAAKLAGVKMVPVVINRTTDKESLELALVENIQREDLNCVDSALAYQQLCEEFNLTQEEAAKRVGKDRASVANHLRLLRLPEAVLDDLKKNVLSFGHGKAILALEDSDQRLWVRAQVVSKQLSVRETETMVEKLKSGTSQEEAAPKAAKPDSSDPVKSRLHNISQDLTRHYSARVEVKGSDKRGKIVLHYTSRLELERLLSSMQK